MSRPLGFAANGDAIWKSWDLALGLQIVRKIERIAALHGAHVALGGGVMKRGRSTHDLDVVLFPHNGPNGFHYEALVEALAAVGITRWRTVAQVHRHWRSIGATDDKHVEVFAWRNRRIDIIRVRS